MARRPGTGPNRTVRRSTYADEDNIADADLRAAIDTAVRTGHPDVANTAVAMLRDGDSEEDVLNWITS